MTTGVSLVRQVFAEEMLLQTILKYLDNMNDLGSIQGAVSLHAVGILSDDDLRQHFARYEGRLFGVFFDAFEYVNTNTPIYTDVMNRPGIEDLAFHEFLDPKASRKEIVSYIVELHSSSRMSFPSHRKGMRSLASKASVLKEYGFLTYVPKSIYVVAQKGIQAKKLLESHSVRDIIRKGEFNFCLFNGL